MTLQFASSCCGIPTAAFDLSSLRQNLGFILIILRVCAETRIIFGRSNFVFFLRQKCQIALNGWHGNSVICGETLVKWLPACVIQFASRQNKMSKCQFFLYNYVQTKAHLGRLRQPCLSVCGIMELKFRNFNRVTQPQLFGNIVHYLLFHSIFCLPTVCWKVCTWRLL